LNSNISHDFEIFILKLLAGKSSEIMSPLIAIKVRNSSQNTPVNLGVMFVPQQEAWVVERMGKFNKILSPVLITKFQTKTNLS
jgi:hypothetical protein